MNTNSSDNLKKYMPFIAALLLTLLFFGLTLGLALRPYSTIMPYMYKHEGTMVKGFLEDGHIRIVVKGQDDKIEKYEYENADKDIVNAFEIKHVRASVNGTRLNSMGMKNVGNFVCVFLFAFITVFGIGITTYTGITAFHKKK